MQFSMQLVSHCWKKKSLGSCSTHVTPFNVKPQLAMVSKSMLQAQAAAFNGLKIFAIIEKVEPSSAANVMQCKSRCNGAMREVAGRLPYVTCPLSHLFHSFFRLAAIAQSRAWYCFL